MVSSFYGSTNMFFSCRCRCRYRYRLLQIKGAKNRYLCCRTVFKHKGSRASLKYFHVLLLYTSTLLHFGGKTLFILLYNMYFIAEVTHFLADSDCYFTLSAKNTLIAGEL